MFARLPGLLGLALIAGCAVEQRPIRIPVDATPAPSLATACHDRDGWSDAAPPARIFGDVYYVGTCGITALLIVGDRGHVLIDGATAEAAPAIAANIRRLGFRPQDVRYILNSHEHIDHAGGLAELKRLTGAQLVARAEAREGLETGRTDPADPQYGTIPDFEGARVDRVIADGETLRVGRLVLTARATPGHTNGGTSWTWRSCNGADCRGFVYADSLTAVGPDSYRFADYPARAAPFRATFAKVAALPCDVLITPHPGASNLFARIAGEAPLRDANACRAYAEAGRRRLDERLAHEGGR